MAPSPSSMTPRSQVVTGYPAYSVTTALTTYHSKTSPTERGTNMSAVIFEHTDSDDDRFAVAALDEGQYMVSIRHQEEGRSHLVQLDRAQMQALVQAVQKDLYLGQHTDPITLHDTPERCSYHYADESQCKRESTRKLNISAHEKLIQICTKESSEFAYLVTMPVVDFGAQLCEHHAKHATMRIALS
jgi:hypothetical protein